MTGMWKLSDQGFKTTMLRSLMNQVDSIHEQMGNISRDAEF